MCTSQWNEFRQPCYALTFLTYKVEKIEPKKLFPRGLVYLHGYEETSRKFVVF